MFAYCENNPINGSDPDGDMVWWAAAALGGAAFEVASYLIGNAISGQKSTWKGAAKAALTGALGAVGKGIQAVSKAAKVAKAAKTAKAAKQASAINNGACFVAGTAVLTSDGYVSIEDIRAGDKVWAENTETGEKELKEVVRTFINETCELVHVFVNGEEIVATPEHPFYVLTKGWTGAGELHPGDILTLQCGDIAIVETVWYEALDDTIKVYNFEVEDFHTYYVGDSNGVLVHNSCFATPKLPQNGIKVNSSDALDLADDFLGKGYSEASPGRFISSDGARQVRMTSSDLSPVNNHAGAPHLNFETLAPNPLKPGKMKITGNVHVFIYD